MRALCLILRARAVDNFFLRAASILEITDGEQRALNLENYRWRAASTSSYFVSLPLAGISLLLSNVVLRRVIVNNRAHAETSKSEQ